MSARAVAALIAVLAVVGLLTYGLLSKGGTTLQIGDRVPDKVLPKLGEPGTGKIADYRGRWVLLNLWASWCIPCRQEAPVLEHLWRTERKHGLVVLGTNVEDNSADALAFMQSYRLTFPQLRSVGSERMDALGASGVPENFLVNPRGRLAWHLVGPVDDRLLGENVLPVLAKAAHRKAAAQGKAEGKG